MDQDYTHESIRVLEEIEHIQTNPGMYIGDTANPTHLVFELLDNALDEAQAGHANLVGIEIDTKKHIVSVADNGRGIPIENDTINTIATKLFSGGKFDKGQKGVYTIASGLHGIGIVAVTALSEFMEIEVHRDNQHAHYKFENAKATESNVEPVTADKTPFSTQVLFKPHKKYFEALTFDIQMIRDRLKIASVHIPSLTLILIVDDTRETISCDMDSYFNEELLSDFNEKTSQLTPIMDLNVKVKDESLHIKFCWELGGKATPRMIGCVNLLNVKQGTHINRSFDLFRTVIHNWATKQKIKIDKQDCLIGFRGCTTIMLYQPQYTSQTKERLAVPKTKLDHLFSIAEKKFAEIFNSNTELHDSLLNYFQAYRKKLDSSKKIIKTDGNTVTRFNSVIDSKLRDCSTHSVDMSELFITEGASAGGSLIQCRNPKYHAILSLKGKIPNIAADSKDFLKNKEIIEIINALGTGIEPDFSIDGLRYGKIIFATDADADGCAGNNNFVYIQFKDEQIQKIKLSDIIDNPDTYQDCLILGYDEEVQEFIWTSILKIWPYKYFKKWLDIELEDGSIISLTHDHLVLTSSRGWIEAQELEEQDDIIDTNISIENSKTFSNL